MGGFRELAQALRWFGHDPVPLAFRFALAALFAAAGLYKVRHPLVAATAAVDFRVVGHARASVGYVFGGLEISTAMLLLAPISRASLATGCALAGMLSAAFVFVTARAVHAHESFPCRCLSASGATVSAVTLARATAMTVAASASLWALAAGAPVLPSATSATTAAGLAAALLGLPVCLHTVMTVWRAYRNVLAETDWEWIFAERSGHVHD